jgi:hypothetical protein
LHRVFIWHTGALGDFVRFAFVIDSIRAHWPACRIHLAGPVEIHRALFGERSEMVFHGNSEARFCRLFDETPTWSPDLSAFFSNFDLAIFVSADPQGHLARRIQGETPPCPMILHAPFPISPATERPSGEDLSITGKKEGSSLQTENTPMRTSMVRHHEKLLVKIACPQVARSPLEKRSPGAYALAQPGSGSQRKNWPSPSFRAVMRRVDSLPWRVLLGPAEGMLQSEFSGLDVATNLSLAQVRVLLDTCRFYLGNDSGISQWAGYLGCRGVLIVPKPNLWFHDPPWPGLTVLSTPDPHTSPTVEEVVAAIERNTNGAIFE